jgi:preprotein translocase subunit SecG
LQPPRRNAAKPITLPLDCTGADSALKAALIPVATESLPPVITFLLVIHGLITLGLVAVILLQRSEGGALGIGGGGGGGLMTARGAANLLTRATTILAILFIVMSIVLAVLAAGTNKARVIDANAVAPAPAQTTPAGPPAAPPAAPTGVPIAQ